MMYRPCVSFIPLQRNPSGVSPTPRRDGGCHISTTHGAISPKSFNHLPICAASQSGPSHVLRNHGPSHSRNPLLLVCRRCAMWGRDYRVLTLSTAMAGFMHLFMWLQLHCSVAKPMLELEGEDENGRLPVVIFSHGMWSCRTTYTITCCDMASHGYSEFLNPYSFQTILVRPAIAAIALAKSERR